ncbi:hypothetical protein [Sinimarinibacterium flocculans]|uniref:hypothetical protein n=1 Tax=Sinimarinibacterium flocculans TaxID=985250 RepID=UPI002490F894|nr:hypothetical protein [Sinimarinibacterium flocculans]
MVHLDLPGLIHLLRSAGGAMLVQISLYGALAQVEWAQERRRLLDVIVTALLGMVGLIAMLLFSGMLALALAWGTAYRLPVALVLVLLYGLGCVIAWVRLRALLQGGIRSFAVTRCELAADLAALKAALR